MLPTFPIKERTVLNLDNYLQLFTHIQCGYYAETVNFVKELSANGM